MPDLVELMTTYLEMGAAPREPALPPPVDGVIVGREFPDATSYLDLYRAVGTPVQWDYRLKMPTHELQGFLSSPATHVFILRLADRPVGLCEFDRVGEPDVELKHFGLIPEVQGQGLGPHLLDRALRSIWAIHGTRRVWLHTDTNDHPKAVSVYQRAGFRIFAERFETYPD